MYFPGDIFLTDIVEDAIMGHKLDLEKEHPVLYSYSVLLDSLDEEKPKQNAHFCRLEDQCLNTRFTWREALWVFEHRCKHSSGKEEIKKRKVAALLSGRKPQAIRNLAKQIGKMSSFSEVLETYLHIKSGNNSHYSHTSLEPPFVDPCELRKSKLELGPSDQHSEKRQLPKEVKNLNHKRAIAPKFEITRVQKAEVVKHEDQNALHEPVDPGQNSAPLVNPSIPEDVSKITVKVQEKKGGFFLRTVTIRDPQEEE